MMPFFNPNKLTLFFLFLLTLSSNVAGSNQRQWDKKTPITYFKMHDAGAADRQLAGRMRSNIAFDGRLQKETIAVVVKQSKLILSGELTHPNLVNEVVAQALLLVPRDQIVLRFSVRQQTESPKEKLGFSR